VPPIGAVEDEALRRRLLPVIDTAMPVAAGERLAFAPGTAEDYVDALAGLSPVDFAGLQ
jgi:hypothetical protein